MNIVFGENVDLVCPFPAAEATRVWGWMQCYRSTVLHDDSVMEPEAYNAHAAALAEAGLAYGIIDKHNRVGSEVDAPLVGIVAFEPGSPGNVYIHVATSRRCGRSYKLYGVSLVDEAVSLACQDMFERFGDLRRISAVVLASNSLVSGLAKRTGFESEGRLRHWFSKNGELQDALHYGKVRPLGAALEVNDVVHEESN
jgi:RimJ/RimL family protein N-acetyltransferase